MAKSIDINEAYRRIKPINPDLKILEYKGWTFKSKVTDGEYTYDCRLETIFASKKPWANHPVKGKDSKYTKGITKEEALERLKEVLPTVKIKDYKSWTKECSFYCTETKLKWKNKPHIACMTILCGRPRQKTDWFKHYTKEFKIKFGSKYKLMEYKASKSIIKCKKHGEFVHQPWSSLNQRFCGCKQCLEEHLVKRQEMSLNEQRKTEYPNGVKFLDKTRFGRLYNCPIHGNFYSTESKVLKGCGCLRCIADQYAHTELALKIPKGIKRLPFKDHLRKLRLHFTWLKIKKSKTKGNVKCTCLVCGHKWETNYQNLRSSRMGCVKCGTQLTKTKTSNEPKVHTSKSGNNSVKGNQWLLFLEKKLGLTLQGAHHIGEKMIQLSKQKAFVDGYCEDTNEVFEFLGDYWHGNALSKFKDKDKYANTIKRLQEIASLGYTVHYVWESDFDKGLAISGTFYSTKV